MSNQEEKKCEHDWMSDGIDTEICQRCGDWRPFCKPTEAKQEPKEYLLHNDSDVPLEVYPDFESARDAGIKKKMEPMNIKTQEEVAKEIQ